MTGLEHNKTYTVEVEDVQEREEREGGEGCIVRMMHPAEGIVVHDKYRQASGGWR